MSTCAHEPRTGHSRSADAGGLLVCPQASWAHEPAPPKSHRSISLQNPMRAALLSCARACARGRKAGRVKAKRQHLFASKRIAEILLCDLAVRVEGEGGFEMLQPCSRTACQQDVSALLALALSAAGHDQDPRAPPGRLMSRCPDAATRRARKQRRGRCCALCGVPLLCAVRGEGSLVARTCQEEARRRRDKEEAEGQRPRCTS